MRIVEWVILGPAVVLSVWIAVANRQIVRVSLDPFSASAPAVGVEMPLYLVMFLAVFAGLLLGAALMWVLDGRLRRRLRLERARVKRLEAARADPATIALPASSAEAR